MADGMLFSMDASLLDQLHDAVFVIETGSLAILYQNPASTTLLNPSIGICAMDVMPAAVVRFLIALKPPFTDNHVITPEECPQIHDNMILRTVGLTWENRDAILFSVLQCSDLPEAAPYSLQQRVLEATQYLSLTIDAQTMQTTLLHSHHPLLSVLQRFPSLDLFSAFYTSIVLHPDDQLAFQNLFSETSCKRFLRSGNAPTATLRHRVKQEDVWASYTLQRLDRNTLLLTATNTDLQRQQESNAQYQRALDALSQRNAHILSGVSDIFRLMLHIDLKTHATVVCSMHGSLQNTLSYDMVYPFEAIVEVLLSLVHPEDVKTLRRFSDLSQYKIPLEENSRRIHAEYRRITPSRSGGDDTEPKWTRSVLQLMGTKGEIPTEAIYAVQDVNDQKRRELQAIREQDHLQRKFDVLIKNRFLCFIDSDYQAQVSECSLLHNGEISHQFTCPFERLFEMAFIPYCHPEDIKLVAKTFMPDAVIAADTMGKKQVGLTYRFRTPDGWKWVRCEMYLLRDDRDLLRSMTYISDVDEEVRATTAKAEAEHQQLILRKKFGLSVQDSYISIDEVDLEADRLYHYQLENDNYVLIPHDRPFSQLCETYPEQYVHPDQLETFCHYFSYQALLRASRNRTSLIKQQFLLDLQQNQNYIWCSFVARFFRDENGKPFMMLYLENIDPEVREREQRLQQLEQAKQELKQTIRLSEQSRIRKAHFLTNITADAKLSLNHITGSLDHLRQTLSLSEEQCHDFATLLTACDHVTNMVENMRDVLLLENHMLPLMKEPISLPELFASLKEKAQPILQAKQIRLTTFVSHVVNEIIYCDAARLLHIVESVFLQIIRALPNETNVTLRLTQSPGKQDNTAVYEFSMITYGDRFSQDFQKSLCTPLRALSGLNPIERSMFAENGQDNLNMHINKKLIALMHGNLDFVQLEGDASAVLLTIPFAIAMEPPCVFPNLHLYQKRALIWEPMPQAAFALKEMLNETGMQILTLPDEQTVISTLKDAAAQQPIDVLLLPQSILNANEQSLLRVMKSISPDTAFLIRSDVPASQESMLDAQAVDAMPIPSPIFRTALARHLWAITNTHSAAPELLGDLPNCSGKRVLLIAASESVLEQAALALQKAHATIYKAWSGAQAIQMLTNAPTHFYDIALIDLQLADEISGSQILSTIRSINREDIHTMPIYGVTDHPSPQIKLLGLTDFLAKPLQHDALQKLLTTLSELP